MGTHLWSYHIAVSSEKSSGALVLGLTAGRARAFRSALEHFSQQLIIFS